MREEKDRKLRKKEKKEIPFKKIFDKTLKNTTELMFFITF